MVLPEDNDLLYIAEEGVSWPFLKMFSWERQCQNHGRCTVTSKMKFTTATLSQTRSWWTILLTTTTAIWSLKRNKERTPKKLHSWISSRILWFALKQTKKSKSNVFYLSKSSSKVFRKSTGILSWKNKKFWRQIRLRSSGNSRNGRLNASKRKKG